MNDGGGKNYVCRESINEGYHDWGKGGPRSKTLLVNNFTSEVTQVPEMIHKTIRILVTWEIFDIYAFDISIFACLKLVCKSSK